MIAWSGLEPGLVCASGELLFLGKHTACVVGRLLYLGIGGLIPGGGYTQSFGHPDEIRAGLGAHLAHDLTAVHLNGDVAATQFGSDLLVEQNQVAHRPTTTRQKRQATGESRISVPSPCRREAAMGWRKKQRHAGA